MTEQYVFDTMSDSLRMRLILELIESIQDKLEGIEEKLDDQRAMLAALDVARSFPETKRTDELKPGDSVWWPWVEGDPITATLDVVSKCGGLGDCWFVRTTTATEGRSIHADAYEEWQMATPGERMGFE